MIVVKICRHLSNAYSETIFPILMMFSYNFCYIVLWYTCDASFWNLGSSWAGKPPLPWENVLSISLRAQSMIRYQCLILQLCVTIPWKIIQGSLWECPFIDAEWFAHLIKCSLSWYRPTLFCSKFVVPHKRHRRKFPLRVSILQENHPASSKAASPQNPSQL